MRVTDHFKLGVASGSVKFVDVNVLRDNRLYVDPSAVRIQASRGNRWAKRAENSLTAYFDVILRCLGNPAEYQHGKDSLAEFHEPKETRLGMSGTGFDGAGASRELGERIWNSLLSNPICGVKVALLKRVEDIALYVEDISNDRVSDLTTRIIIKDLVAFTHEQMTAHPGLAANPMNHTIQVWDATAEAWTTDTFTLPRVVSPGAADAPLILVPKKLVHLGLRMSAGGFWSVTAIGAVQDDETRWVQVTPKRKRALKPRKEDLKKRSDLAAVRPTNTAQTMRIWERDGRSLLEDYRAYVNGRFQPVSEATMDEKIPS